MSTRILPRRPRLGGFTLVELLVVIGIIALLIGILLPVLSQARRAAKITVCLSNIRQLGQTTAMYLNDNKFVLPEAAYSNGYDGDSATSHNVPAWTPITYPHNGRSTYALPPIGRVLEPYVGEGNDDPWICPEAGWAADGQNEGYEVLGDGWNGHVQGQDYWRPTYFYMNTKNFSFYYDFSGESPTGDPYGWRPGDWAVRNIAGLPVTSAQTMTGQGSSDVILFIEYKSYYHSEQSGDVYAMTDGRKSEYKATYAFVDGHAETREYEDLDGYIGRLHEPVYQQWYGVNWPAAWPGLYHPYQERYPRRRFVIADW